MKIRIVEPVGAFKAGQVVIVDDPSGVPMAQAQKWLQRGVALPDHEPAKSAAPDNRVQKPGQER